MERSQTIVVSVLELEALSRRHCCRGISCGHCLSLARSSQVRTTQRTCQLPTRSHALTHTSPLPPLRHPLSSNK